MTTQKKHPDRPAQAQTMQELAAAKQERAQQTPPWPGAKEQAQPQHVQPETSAEAPPRDLEKTPPSRSGYERDDINKRHH